MSRDVDAPEKTFTPVSSESFSQVNTNIDAKREEVAWRQSIIQGEIDAGRIIDPMSGHVPLEKLDQKNAMLITNIGSFAEHMSTEPKTDDAKEIAERVKANLENAATLGLLGEDGREKGMSGIHKSPQAMQNAMTEMSAEPGEYYVIYSEPTKEDSPTPVVLRKADKGGNLQFVPWVEDSRFINHTEAEYMADAWARAHAMREENHQRKHSSGDTQLDS